MTAGSAAPPLDTKDPDGSRHPSRQLSATGGRLRTVNSDAAGAVGVKGLNAVDSAKRTSNIFKDVEKPPDQGLCAGNGSVVETNNIGEMLVFNTALKRTSSPISLDTVMGLAKRGWSSGGDPSCLYDKANGGHWYCYTENVKASPESKGGAFTGCFGAVAYDCYEGIAVSRGSSPFGPYNVYFAKANYDPSEPGYPYLLNDFAKISTTRDAFLMFYDEFPLNPSAPGFGGGVFNGAQETAFNKAAFEHGLSAGSSAFTVARENMGLIPTPNGTCSSDDTYHEGGIACSFARHSRAAAGPEPVRQQSWRLRVHGRHARLLRPRWQPAGGLGLDGPDGPQQPRLLKLLWHQLRRQLFSRRALLQPQHRIQLRGGLPGSAKDGPIPLGRECGAAGLSSVSSCRRAESRPTATP